MTQNRRTRCASVVASTAVAVAAVAALVLMAPAFACTITAHVEVRPNRVDPGTAVRVEGSGFEPAGGPVNVFLGGENGALLATASPSGGRFAVDLAVPSDLARGQRFLVLAVQPDTNPTYSGTATLRTSPPSAPPAADPPPAAPAPPLPAPAAQAAPAPAPVSADGPVSPPVDRSGFSSSGAPAFSHAGQPIAPLVADERKAFGGRVHAAGGRSPWVLLPLGVLGLTLFAAAGAAVVRQARTEGVRAPV